MTSLPWLQAADIQPPAGVAGAAASGDGPGHDPPPGVRDPLPEVHLVHRARARQVCATDPYVPQGSSGTGEVPTTSCTTRYCAINPVVLL